MKKNLLGVTSRAIELKYLAIIIYPKKDKLIFLISMILKFCLDFKKSPHYFLFYFSKMSKIVAFTINMD